jgi:hypothetical protein
MWFPLPQPKEVEAVAQTKRPSRRPDAGVEVLSWDFQDEHWKADSEMESILIEEGRDFEYVRILLSKILPADNAEQIRTLSKSDEKIETYTISLMNGAVFPAGVVDQNFHRIDLHHRLAAAEKAGLDRIVVLRVKQDLQPFDRSRLAVLRNMRHGIPLTAGERMAWAVRAMRAGQSQEEAAREWGVPVTTLRRARQKAEMVNRAQDLGVSDDLAKVQKSSQSAIAVAGLHDEPFRAAVRLAALRGFNGIRTKEFVRDIENAKSDEAAMTVIQDWERKTAPAVQRRTRVADTDQANYTRFLREAENFRIVLDDKKVIDSLTKIPSDDVKFPEVQRVLAALEPGWDVLLNHFGVEGDEAA